MNTTHMSTFELVAIITYEPEMFIPCDHSPKTYDETYDHQ